jgi:hypothetical protein
MLFLLPISPPSSLKYGISSPTQLSHPTQPIPCGLSDPPLQEALTHVGSLLNLAPHSIGNTANHVITTHCADLESHRSYNSNNHIYILDTARVLPPSFLPDAPREKADHLTKLLRPEFVIRWSTPLSPDALSKFTLITERQAEFTSVSTATMYLIHELIPYFAKRFEQYVIANVNRDNFAELNTVLREKMKRAGINMRHLGLVRMSMTNEVAKAIVLAECVARVAKTDVRTVWRDVAKQPGLPGVVKFETATVKYLNKLLGWRTGESETFWTGILQMRVMRKYSDGVFSDEELEVFSTSEAAPLRDMLLPFFSSIFARLVEMLQLSIDPNTASELKGGDWKTIHGPPLESVDLMGIGCGVKKPTVAVVACAMELVEAAKSRGAESLRMWRMAEKALFCAVQQSTMDSSILSHLANVFVVIAELLHSSQKHSGTSEVTEEVKRYLHKACQRSLETIRMASEMQRWRQRGEASMKKGGSHWCVLEQLTHAVDDEQQQQQDTENNSYDMSFYDQYDSGGPAYETIYAEPSYEEFYDGSKLMSPSTTAKSSLPTLSPASPPHPSVFVAPNHEQNLDLDSPALEQHISLSLADADNAALVDREGVATALNTLARSFYLLSTVRHSCELLNLSLSCFSRASKLAGFDHEGTDDESDPRGGVSKRRSSHHMSLGDRSQNNALENAIAHARALLFRTSFTEYADTAVKQLDIKSALVLIGGVQSFLNLQSHVKDSPTLAHLMKRTQKTFELAAFAKDGLMTARLLPVGIRRSADLKVKERSGHLLILVGAVALNGAEACVFALFDDGEIMTYKHMYKENCFTKEKTGRLLLEGTGMKLSKDEVAFCDKLGVIGLIAKDGTVDLFDCVSLEKLCGGVDVQCCSDGDSGEEPTLHIDCEVWEKDDDDNNKGGGAKAAAGFFGTVELTLCVGLGKKFAITRCDVRIATEGAAVFVLGMGAWSSAVVGMFGSHEMLVLAFQKISGRMCVIYCDAARDIASRLFVKEVGDGGGGFVFEPLSDGGVGVDELYHVCCARAFLSGDLPTATWKCAVLYEETAGGENPIYKVAVVSLLPNGGGEWTTVKPVSILSYAGCSDIMMTANLFCKRDDFGLVTAWRDAGGGLAEKYRLEYKSYRGGDFRERNKIDIMGQRGVRGGVDLLCSCMKGGGDNCEGLVYGFLDVEDDERVMAGVRASFE